MVGTVGSVATSAPAGAHGWHCGWVRGHRYPVPVVVSGGGVAEAAAVAEVGAAGGDRRQSRALASGPRPVLRRSGKSSELLADKIASIERRWSDAEHLQGASGRQMRLLDEEHLRFSAGQANLLGEASKLLVGHENEFGRPNNHLATFAMPGRSLPPLELRGGKGRWCK